jgi:hypothetical protein
MEGLLCTEAERVRASEKNVLHVPFVPLGGWRGHERSERGLSGENLRTPPAAGEGARVIARE